MASHNDDGAVHERPGAAMAIVAGQLTACGFAVHGPDWDEGRVLTVTGLRDTTCHVTVEDSGYVTWEYAPSSGTGPDKIIGRVMRLLADPGAELPRLRQSCPATEAEAKSVVGRWLKAAGMAVDLEVYPDYVSFEVAAELTVANPARPANGQVNATGNGELMWECGYEEDGCDPAAIASTIAAVLAADLADGSIQRGEAVLAGSGQDAR